MSREHRGTRGGIIDRTLIWIGSSIWHVLLMSQVVAFSVLFFDQLALGKHVFW